MANGRTKKKEDPLAQYVSYYLEVREWHVSYSGPTWRREDIPHPDWRGGPDWLEHKYEIEHEESLDLRLLVTPYRSSLVVSKRAYDSLRFTVHSSAEPHGGLFQLSADHELHGWVFLPRAGVEALLALLIAGRSVVLEVNGSAFKRGRALVRTNSGWSTVGHPELEAEFS